MTEDQMKKIITDTIGFTFEPGELQPVNADDLLRLARALTNVDLATADLAGYMVKDYADGWFFVPKSDQHDIAVARAQGHLMKPLFERSGPGLLPSIRVRHKKRMSTYKVVGDAEGQISTTFHQPPLSRMSSRLAHEGDVITVYQDEETGKLWWRFKDEFDDGRFEQL